MARQPRQFMRQGVADLPTRDAVNNYVGVRGEPIFDGDTLRMMTGDKPGGISMVPQGLRLPAYPQGVPFTWYDQFGPYVDAHLVSDGSGGVADDQRAIAQAVAIAAKSTTDKKRAVLISRPFSMTEQVVLGKGIEVIGAVEGQLEGELCGATIVPRAKMDSCFHIVSHSGGVRGLTLRATIDPTAVSNRIADPFTDKLPTSATAFISVKKDFDAYKTTIRDIKTYGVLFMVEWIDGAVPDISNLLGQQTGCGIFSRNNFLNGQVSDINVEQGAALYLGRGKHPSLTGPKGTTGGPQGCEGTTFIGIRGAQTVAPAFDLTIPPIWVQSGFGLTFLNAQPLEVTRTDGMLIQGLSTEEPVQNIFVYGGFATTNRLGVTGDRTGYQVSGVCASVHLMGVQSNGFAYNVGFNGKSGAAGELLDNCSLSHAHLFNATRADFQSANVYACAVDHNKMVSSSASVYEIANSRIVGRGNTMNATPQQISPLSTWEEGFGPGHPVGMPTIGVVAANPTLFDRSRKYIDGQGFVRVNGA